MVEGQAATITRWDEQGRLSADLQVRNGTQSGVVLSWYDSGAKRSETQYQDNEVVRKMLWDEDGTPYEEQK